MTNFKTVAGIALITGMLLVAISGCEEGPAEEAGENIDESAEKVGESLENAGDSIQEAGQDAAEY